MSGSEVGMEHGQISRLSLQAHPPFLVLRQDLDVVGRGVRSGVIPGVEHLDDGDIQIIRHPTPTSSTRTSRLIEAPRESIYRAFIDPVSLETWMAPDEMAASVHALDDRVGGGYEMSLTYPTSEPGNPGKSTDREDRYTARFVELTAPARIVEVITFDTSDPAFTGEMTMTVTLDEANGGTNVTMLFEHIPSGIRPEDNEAGTRSSLEKLARFIDAQS